MSRLDGKLDASDDGPLELAELLAALEAQGDAARRDWRDAIACYLSASDGWRDAVQVLGGTFASTDGESGLSPRKEP